MSRILYYIAVSRRSRKVSSTSPNRKGIPNAQTGGKYVTNWHARVSGVCSNAIRFARTRWNPGRAGVVSGYKARRKLRRARAEIQATRRSRRPQELAFRSSPPFTRHPNHTSLESQDIAGEQWHRTQHFQHDSALRGAGAGTRRPKTEATCKLEPCEKRPTQGVARAKEDDRRWEPIAEDRGKVMKTSKQRMNQRKILPFERNPSGYEAQASAHESRSILPFLKVSVSARPRLKATPAKHESRNKKTMAMRVHGQEESEDDENVGEDRTQAANSELMSKHTNEGHPKPSAATQKPRHCRGPSQRRPRAGMKAQHRSSAARFATPVRSLIPICKIGVGETSEKRRSTGTETLAANSEFTSPPHARDVPKPPDPSAKKAAGKCTAVRLPEGEDHGIERVPEDIPKPPNPSEKECVQPQSRMKRSSAKRTRSGERGVDAASPEERRGGPLRTTDRDSTTELAASSSKVNTEVRAHEEERYCGVERSADSAREWSLEPQPAASSRPSDLDAKGMAAMRQSACRVGRNCIQLNGVGGDNSTAGAEGGFARAVTDTQAVKDDELNINACTRTCLQSAPYEGGLERRSATQYSGMRMETPAAARSELDILTPKSFVSDARWKRAKIRDGDLSHGRSFRSELDDLESLNAGLLTARGIQVADVEEDVVTEESSQGSEQRQIRRGYNGTVTKTLTVQNGELNVTTPVKDGELNVNAHAELPKTSDSAVRNRTHVATGPEPGFGCRLIAGKTVRSPYHRRLGEFFIRITKVSRRPKRRCVRSGSGGELDVPRDLKIEVLLPQYEAESDVLRRRSTLPHSEQRESLSATVRNSERVPHAARNAENIHLFLPGKPQQSQRDCGLELKKE
ncbi:hypothetical protein B0H13DRAFT_1874787 [Mycena leptocephala]|nr:hypothetical protein B0H13DRAFT_1874787 [Mycena leptocephala]